VGLQRFRDADDSGGQVQALLVASRLAVRRGSLDEARHLARTAVEIDSGCAEAWLQLAWLAQDPHERKALLQQVLSLEPGHTRAQAELAHLQASSLPSPTARKAPQRHIGRWVLASLVLVAALLLLAILVWGPVDRSLAEWHPPWVPTVTPTPTRTPGELVAQFEPQLQAALARQDWERALEISAIILSVDPSGEQAQRWAVGACMQYGQALVQAGQANEALAQFSQAVALAPGDVEAQLWQQVTQLYLAGREALVARDGPTAIQALTQAYERMPDYSDLPVRVVEAYRLQGQAAMEAKDWTLAIKSLTEARERSQAPHAQSPDDSILTDLLAAAYRERGIAAQELGELQAARTDLETALALRPGDEEAKSHYDDVMYILFPPKRIEINISKQRFYAWLGDELIYSFPTSTGLPGRDTAAGNYQVLDKMPMAYSSIWRLKMPYWLGIYYVGPVENGIHALPIRPDGSVMWGGLLGQKASYGCIILSTEAARIIYEWAEIGTPVHIHY
jgi:tetratricopeptide (TPR) repeat protein